MRASRNKTRMARKVQSRVYMPVIFSQVTRSPNGNRFAERAILRDRPVFCVGRLTRTVYTTDLYVLKKTSEKKKNKKAKVKDDTERNKTLFCREISRLCGGTGINFTIAGSTRALGSIDSAMDTNEFAVVRVSGARN